MQAVNLKPLTSLRFFAAAWVVLYDVWPKLAAAPASSLIEKGYLGVELFFVLSGFILCHVYLEAAGEGGFNYAGFLWARLARIYPLHLATLLGLGLMGLAATAAGFQVDPSVLAWSALPANLTLTHAWGLAPQAGWNHPSWSISAEWFAYLEFSGLPWSAWSLRRAPMRRSRAPWFCWSACTSCSPRLAGFELDQATIAWGALRIVPCFAYGCAIYLLWRSGAVRRRAAAIAGASISGAAVLSNRAGGRRGRGDRRPVRTPDPLSRGARVHGIEHRIATDTGLSGRDKFRHVHGLHSLEPFIREYRHSVIAHADQAIAFAHLACARHGGGSIGRRRTSPGGTARS